MTPLYLALFMRCNRHYKLNFLSFFWQSIFRKHFLSFYSTLDPDVQDQDLGREWPLTLSPRVVRDNFAIDVNTVMTTYFIILSANFTTNNSLHLCPCLVNRLDRSNLPASSRPSIARLPTLSRHWMGAKQSPPQISSFPAMSSRKRWLPRRLCHWEISPVHTT